MIARRGAAVERVLAALRQAGSKIERSGAGYKAQCPVHADEHPSLGITQGAKGARVRCWSQQCPQDQVLAALGLARDDLLDQPGDDGQPGGEWTPKGPAVEVYHYTDEGGNLLFQVLRTAEKEFPQRRPDPSARSGWRWKLDGVRRVPYRLPEVIRAVAEHRTVWLVEGEKDVHALEAAGVTASCNPGGAGKWKTDYDRYFAGADVRMVADKDEPGRRHAVHVAEALRRVGATVQILEALQGKDAADHIAAGHSIDTFSVIQSEPIERDSEPCGTANDTTGGRGPSAATIVARYAQERYRFHRDGYDEPYALPVTGPRIARYLRGARSLRAELARIYLEEQHKPANSPALADALAAIEGMALIGDVRNNHMRVAAAQDGVYLDLGHDDAAAVHVTASGWRVVESPPVIWRRTRKTRALPEPSRGGSLDDLWPVARVPMAERPLVAAWQVCALLDMITPVLNIIGEHGSGKTSAAKAVAGAIDTARPGTVPGNAVDLVIGAHARYITILDNLSHIQPWLADALCRLVTGDELDRRMLWTDSDVATLSLHRPVITTTIDTGAAPPDYADRRVNVHVPVLDEAEGISESQWEAKNKAAQSKIMGAVLDLTSAVLAILPSVKLARIPRMGDYARVLAAVDEVLGTTGLKEYRRQRELASAESVTSDPVGSRLIVWADDQKAVPGGWPWRGSMQELLGMLTPDQLPKDWPKSPRGLAARLAKLGPDLRKLGLDAGDTGGQDPVTRRAIWMIQEVPVRSFGSFDASETASRQGKRPEELPEGSPGADRHPSGLDAEGSRLAAARSSADPSDSKPGMTCVDEGSNDPKDPTGTYYEPASDADDESFWAGLGSASPYHTSRMTRCASAARGQPAPSPASCSRARMMCWRRSASTTARSHGSTGARARSSTSPGYACCAAGRRCSSSPTMAGHVIRPAPKMRSAREPRCHRVTAEPADGPVKAPGLRHVTGSAAGRAGPGGEDPVPGRAGP